PPRPKDWSFRPPRRVRSMALRGALSLLVKEGRFTVVEKIDLGEIKTKKLAVDDKSNENLGLSIRNLRDSRFLPPEGVNVYDLLRHEHLVVSKEAVKALEARCKGAKE